MTALMLRALVSDDLEQLRRWRNDPDIRTRCRQLGFLSDVHQARWFERVTSPTTRDWMFGVDAGGLLVGVVGLCHWEPRDGTAEVSFYIGERRARGQGIVSRALRQLHAFGFDELRLHRIWAECYAFNEPGLATLRALGYVEEGRLRQHVYRAGAWHDALMFGLLREEWERQRAEEASV